MIDRQVTLSPRKRPVYDQAACMTVADDLKRIFGRDPIFRHATRTELEFLLSMGLHVKDPSDRVKLLTEAMVYVRVHGKHGRMIR